MEHIEREGRGYWSWIKGGFVLGGCFFLAVALAKPIGVSTQFVVLDGLIAKKFDSSLVLEDSTAKSGFSSTNAYLNKSGGKLAEEVASPLNYGNLFVLFMFVGGLLGGILAKRRSVVAAPTNVPSFHKSRFGESKSLRYLLAFIGGAIVLWGARLAGGCTSGHMMSGMMQTSVSGYLFALAAFAAA
ncbi:MAG: YeeE/YedE family protein, partial [Bdellovibrionales bacterium]|nr:YeeE/YedE family protein [Bdellovibrionales bacterium]